MSKQFMNKSDLKACPSGELSMNLALRNSELKAEKRENNSAIDRFALSSVFLSPVSHLFCIYIGLCTYPYIISLIRITPS